MNKVNGSFKKFLGNKNTVTIVGVVVCIIILYVGYNAQVKRTTNLVSMPVAANDISARTKITKELVTVVNVPGKMLKGDFYEREADIVGKYSNYNVVIPKGSLFYKIMLIDAKDMASVIFENVPEGHTLINQPVDMNTTYVNSVEPDSYVSLYFKGKNDDDKVMFGKFVSNIHVIAVKDAEGNNVFETAEEKRQPAYIIYSVPESVFQLIRKALYIAGEYDIELLLVPNTKKLTDEEKNTVHATSQDIVDFINDKTAEIDVNVMPSADELFNDVKNSKTYQDKTKKNN